MKIISYRIGVVVLVALLVLSWMPSFITGLQPVRVSASGIAEFEYAYDAESVHEKIDGDLINDAAMEGLTYLVIMRNPYYVENAPNSGEWYIVTVREQEEWKGVNKK